MFTEMASQNTKEDVLLHQNSAYQLTSLGAQLLHDALDLHEPAENETGDAEDVDGYVPVDYPVGMARKKTRKNTKKFQGLKSSSSLEDLSTSLLEDNYEPVAVPQHMLKRHTSIFSEGDIPVLQLVNKFESSAALPV